MIIFEWKQYNPLKTMMGLMKGSSSSSSSSSSSGESGGSDSGPSGPSGPSQSSTDSGKGSVQGVSGPKGGMPQSAVDAQNNTAAQTQSKGADANTNTSKGVDTTNTTNATQQTQTVLGHNDYTPGGLNKGFADSKGGEWGAASYANSQVGVNASPYSGKIFSPVATTMDYVKDLFNFDPKTQKNALQTLINDQVHTFEDPAMPGFSSKSIDTAKYNPGREGAPSYNSSPASSENTFSPAAPGANVSNVTSTNNNQSVLGGIVANDGSGGRASAFSNDSSSSSNKGVVGSSSGVTNNGSSVDNGSLASGGSGSLKAPERNTESLGFSKYNKDEANYDQDNWNRGMESQSSGLVSDEACKHFAKRAFADGPAFKKSRITIVERLK